MSHVTQWFWSSQLKSHIVKIGGHCPNEGKDKDFFCISRDHMINESRESVAGPREQLGQGVRLPPNFSDNVPFSLRAL